MAPANTASGRVVESLRRLPGQVIEVFCRCDRDRAWERYQARADDQHSGHFDSVRTIEELWHDDVTERVAGGWSVVDVDTNEPVDITQFLAEINSALR